MIYDKFYPQRRKLLNVMFFTDIESKWNMLQRRIMGFNFEYVHLIFTEKAIKYVAVLLRKVT